MAAVSPFVPDVHGRFGPYGGRYVPETLMHALSQLTEAYAAARKDPEFQQQLQYYLRAVRRPADAAVLRRAADERGRRGADLSQARGPEPHRRSQDQQLHRPGAADAAHGQAADHRRDRCRPARRRHGHRGRPVRLPVPGLHGRGRRSPAAAERLQDAGPGQRGGVGRQRQPYPARRHQ